MSSPSQGCARGSQSAGVLALDAGGLQGCRVLSSLRGCVWNKGAVNSPTPLLPPDGLRGRRGAVKPVMGTAPLSPRSPDTDKAHELFTCRSAGCGAIRTQAVPGPRASCVLGEPAVGWEEAGEEGEVHQGGYFSAP